MRDVEEFKFHPNVFKQELGTGEAVVVIPHAKGSLPIRLQFDILPDLKTPQIPPVNKDPPTRLPPAKGEQDSQFKPENGGKAHVVNEFLSAA